MGTEPFLTFQAVHGANGVTVVTCDQLPMFSYAITSKENRSERDRLIAALDAAKTYVEIDFPK